MQSAIAIEMDYGQERISRDRVQTLIQGLFTSEDGKNTKDGWSKVYRDGNCWVDPVTKTLRLCPLCQHTDWNSNFTGDYDRLAVADFSFPSPNDSTKWTDFTLRGTGDTYAVETASSTVQHEKFITSSAWGNNRGLNISVFMPNTGNEVYKAYSFGYATGLSSGTLSGETLSFDLYTNGRVDVLYGGTVFTSGSVGSSDTSDVDVQDDVKPNTYHDVMVEFLRGRECLVYSKTMGGGFSFVCYWIDEGDESPVINGASTKVWLQCVAGTPAIQLHKLAYKTSGYQTGILSRFLVAPPNATPNGVTIYDDTILSAGTSVGTLRDSTDSAAYSSGLDARIRVTLSHDGTGTPFIFGALAYWDTEVTETYDATFDLTDWIVPDRGALLSVPDSYENETLSFSLKLESTDGTSIEDAGLDRPRQIAFRPVRVVRADGVVLFEGVSMPPRWVDSPVDAGQILDFECRSLWYLLEQYMFHDPIPLDGYALHDAFDLVLNVAGNGNHTVSTSSFTIPSIPSLDGDWNCLVDVGMTGADAVRMLLDAYCQDWYIREVPGAGNVTLELLSQADIGTTPVCEIYRDHDTAISNGVAEVDVRYKLFWAYNETPIMPECNDIFVMGFDPRSKRAIWSHVEDADRKNPATEPASRPLGWRGFPSKYGYQEPRLTTESALQEAMPILEKNLLSNRMCCEFQASTQEADEGRTAWKGDTVTLVGTESQDTRILGFSLSFHLETTAYVYRDCSYTSQHITEDNPSPAMLRVISNSIDGIQSEVSRRSTSSMHSYGPFAHVTAGPPVIVVEYP